TKHKILKMLKEYKPDEAEGKKKLAVSDEKQEDSTKKQEVTTEIEETENDDKVISEIEESNAEDAEDEGSIDRHSIDKKDYEKMSLEALADELEQLVKNQKIGRASCRERG